MLGILGVFVVILMYWWWSWKIKEYLFGMWVSDQAIIVISPKLVTIAVPSGEVISFSPIFSYLWPGGITVSDNKNSLVCNVNIYTVEMTAAINILNLIQQDTQKTQKVQDTKITPGMKAILGTKITFTKDPIASKEIK